MFLQNTGRYVQDTLDNPYNRGDNVNVPREGTAEGRLNQAKEDIRLDSLYGFHRVIDAKERIGFLINMHTTDIIEENSKHLITGVDLYFLEEDCTRFKVSVPYYPYFYILCQEGTIQEVATYLMKKYTNFILQSIVCEKEDLDLANHLSGLKQKYLKLSFLNTTNLTKVRRDIMNAVKHNKEREKSNTFYNKLLAETFNRQERENRKIIDQMDNILDIREHDVPHHIRVSIDLQIFCGTWYTVKTFGTNQRPIIIKNTEMVEPPEPIVLAFDIETSKLPLKFPDANIDQIMMISYMLDGQGYLINNREIIAADIEDFEYTPKPEFEGVFTVYNEENEKALINKFFNHINEVRPHIFVTYNGDFFDWPFVETRAAIHEIDMKERIGFAKDKDGVYTSRASMHLDCLCWVKRDSYLPVGSQGLKAVAKAKLRYDPVEIDPEDMCRLAAEDPETLSNYSVSDAVATYYLYQKYVHPFIFALCTIIPMEPEEVLRKGSGTLCESLLMVQAYAANVIYPDKQEQEFTKFTTHGHLLDSETYVGGHVEALESGVFRADIPYRFKIIPSAVEELIEGIEKALKYALEEEEKVKMEDVLNFEKVVQEIKSKLEHLRDNPMRTERPIIYHLDVGAMYPNIILTNRLQPYAMVDEKICAACDYNKPSAFCQRSMEWTWRGTYLKATQGEYQRIQQQLETEKFPAKFPNGKPRAFNELSKQERASYEKQRLTDYCKRTYKVVKETKTEVRKQTICQRENSFYVDTVRAFRDRRYEYKGLTKKAKQQVAEAVSKNDAAAIKSAKNREVLYDSLQLAHKCILNSFYGYVMRKGSRWFSMEMGGIVCYTGAHIIMKAREIIEQVGRPLELDTDGIWCILPASFPDNFQILTKNEKKPKINLSYPNAILNFMVKDIFTNDVYHELNSDTGEYTIRSENSIFFEVDGPYLAMVLPAAKEEGKKLKKRYAVFNFDKSLAELKGFEVKRRGELRLIKIFQSSVFEAFLKGETLQECYAAVAEIANYWLDILYSKGASMPDEELFDLISENKSMSKKLEDYGAQKSTSISTAKRLAEFLGDEMVKDAGLACKFVISEKPQGSPVTERAIPLAIFQSQPEIAKHYLRRWLKDPGINEIDIRKVLDWNYYIERLGSAIQKIITIPAALQGIPNPVPRVRHPDWLHKKILEKTDGKKQRKINEIFKPVTPNNKENKENKSDEADANDSSNNIGDIEEAGPSNGPKKSKIVVATISKRKRTFSEDENSTQSSQSSQANKYFEHWRKVLGDPPPNGETKQERDAWLAFHRQKWVYQLKQRAEKRKQNSNKRPCFDNISNGSRPRNQLINNTLGRFIQKAQQKLLETPWQIIQLSETNEPGQFRMWVLVDNDLHQVRLNIPRIFYVNSRKDRGSPQENDSWQLCHKILPRSRKVYYLYKYSVPESLFKCHSRTIMNDLIDPEVEGIYETQVPLEMRAILKLGCVCGVEKKARRYLRDGTDIFHLDQLLQKTVSHQPYLKDIDRVKKIFIYHHWSANSHFKRAMWSIFLTEMKVCHTFVLDTVRTDRMPNMNSLYTSEKSKAMESDEVENMQFVPENMQFHVKIETDIKKIYILIQNVLKTYKNEVTGPTLVLIQSPMTSAVLTVSMPFLNEFPIVRIHVQDVDNLYDTLDWQRIGSKILMRHYFKTEDYLLQLIEQATYLYAPIGNLPSDLITFGSDLFYARHLQQLNFVLWWSETEKPDFGGSENDDSRLLSEIEESSGCKINNSSFFSNVCFELEILSLVVDAVLQANHINDIDGTSSYVAFHNQQQTTIQEMVSQNGAAPDIPIYDETALCAPAFRVLRSMVATWLKEVTQYKNMIADCFLVHFHRWLRSPTSHLYDPALRRTLHGYVKKLFIQLISELQNLGAVVVFADFSKIIISTKKHDLEDATGYIEYIVQSVMNKELFHGIYFDIKNCWECLVWLDLSNYGGIKNNRIIQSNEDGSNSQNDDQPVIVMSWSLLDFINTEECNETFTKVIAAYISAYNKSKNNSDNQLIAKLKTFLSNDLSQKLFYFIQAIHKKFPEKILVVEDYPHLATDYHTLKVSVNPALELSKAIVKVLSLDKRIEEEVTSLHRNLLKIIDVGCFSDKAEWKDPTISFTLPEVLCENCNHVRDVDLYKDSLMDIAEDKYIWQCTNCKMNYDNNQIEFTLIDIVNRKSIGYLIQDLQCVSCLEVKRNNVSLICECSGSFKTLTSKNDFIKLLKIFKLISKRSHMNILGEIVQFLLTDVK